MSNTPASFEWNEEETIIEDNISKLVPWNSDILYTPTIPFDYMNPPIHPAQLYNELVAEMIRSHGIGISANQIGYPWSVFVTRDGEAYFNPRIVMYGQETSQIEQACISFPGLILNVTSYNTIKVRYQQLTLEQISSNNDNTVTKTYTGMTAKVIQHEMQHLQGKPFFYDVSRLKLERAVNKCKKEYGIEYLGIFKLIGEKDE